jgi:hypothetical protein
MVQLAEKKTCLWHNHLSFLIDTDSLNLGVGVKWQQAVPQISATEMFDIVLQ